MPSRLGHPDGHGATGAPRADGPSIRASPSTRRHVLGPHARNRELATEIRLLRDQLDRAHGQLRAARLEHTWAKTGLLTAAVREADRRKGPAGISCARRLASVVFPEPGRPHSKINLASGPSSTTLRTSAKISSSWPNLSGLRPCWANYRHRA